MAVGQIFLPPTSRAESHALVAWFRFGLMGWLAFWAIALAVLLRRAHLTSEEREVGGKSAADSLPRSPVTGDAMPSSEGDFRVLFANNPVPMWVYDNATLYFLEVNDAAVAHYGYSRAEFLGMTIKDIRPPEDVPAVIASVVQRPTAYESSGIWRHLTKDGRLRHVRITSHVISFRGRQAVFVLSTDVTEQLANETALRASEQKFRAFVEGINAVFWMVDAKREHFLYVSPSFERVWGRSMATLLADASTWEKSIHPEDRARVMQAVGTSILKGNYAEEYRILRPDGAQRWIRERASPVYTDARRVAYIVGIAEDATAEKSLEGQFLRAQRMDAVGTLASGMAHDLNNILAPVVMLSGMLKEHAVDPRQREILGLMENSARRGSELMRQLLAFSRGVEGVRAPLRPPHLLKEMGSLIRETFPSNIDLIERIPQVWPIVANATQLNQVLLNLCVNARDAMPAGGTVTLGARNQEVPPEQAAQHGSSGGPYVVLFVEDTGIGMSQEVAARVFEPFFTTKAIGRGTGLGLSTVQGIVRGHGGFVSVVSQEGKGSTFSVFLPASPEVDVNVQMLTAPTKLEGNSEFVLIVDDEPAVCSGVRQILEAKQFRVLATGRCEEATALFMQHREQIRVVIIDAMLPGIGSLELVRRFKAMSQTVHCIVTTGGDPEALRAPLEKLQVGKILLKPFSAQELEAAIATMNREV